MLKYILRRLLILPIVLFLVTLILFILIMQLPVEQRVMIYIPSTKPNITPEEMQHLIQTTIEMRGLDKPLPVQYVNWLRNLFRGEWGYSPVWRQKVLQGLLVRVPATAELALAAMIPSIMLALTLGSLAARRYNRLPDHLIRAASFLGWAFPPFVLALMGLNVFYAWLDWFPPERLSMWTSPIINGGSFRTYTGMYTVDALLNGNLPIFLDALRHLVLPAGTLAVTQFALLTRVMRSSMLETLGQDYITTARAKGIAESKIVRAHARPNAILPVISIGGAAVSLLISSTVIVEIIFSINGIGRAAANAMLGADIPVAAGFAIFSCLVVVLASLAVDILYVLADPRIRLY